MTSQYGAYVLRAGLARLYARISMHTHTRPATQMHARTPKHAQTDQYVILLFHNNNDFVNAPHCCVTRTLPALFFLRDIKSYAMPSYFPHICYV